jgi:hypothetical protein
VAVTQPDPAQAPHSPPTDPVDVSLHRGPYLLAPDSADPLPDALWERVDLDNLQSSAAALGAAVDEAARAEREGAAKAVTLAASGGVPIPEATVKFLQQVGGDAIVEALSQLTGPVAAPGPKTA